LNEALLTLETYPSRGGCQKSREIFSRKAHHQLFQKELLVVRFAGASRVAVFL
jgi:hypothetical protein